MNSPAYDLIIIGGGLGGSALAAAMAMRGARVLVLERERQFRDRVRGEYMEPWGVAEAQALGVYETIIGAGAAPLRYWHANAQTHRDLPATTRQRLHALSFYHPHMQEALIETARKAGADVRRGATARDVVPGQPPAVLAELDGRETRLEARLVVACDGRGSSVREWARFDVHHDPDRLHIAGVLLDNVDLPTDGAHVWRDARKCRYALLFPQGNRRVRAYLAYHAQAGFRLSGTATLPQFVAYSIESGVPAGAFAEAKMAGPLASFAGADTWVAHPYREGVALIGDAAASSDPTYGQGLSLTLRDARTLRDGLLSEANWDAAGQAYAEAHDRYYGTLRTWEDWVTRVMMTPGLEADALRARVLPLFQKEPTRLPDMKSGPDFTLDETARQRFFGEI